VNKVSQVKEQQERGIHDIHVHPGFGPSKLFSLNPFALLFEKSYKFTKFLTAILSDRDCQFG
jgi:hypothetical protein